MNRKNWHILFTLISGLFALVLFQNCGKASAIKDNTSTDKNASNTGSGTDADPKIIPIDNDNSSLQLDLNNGDSLSYIEGRTMIPHEKSLTLVSSFGRILALTRVHEPFQFPESPTGPPTLDSVPLSEAYCKDSILPHCQHLSEVPCEGPLCHATTPVKCAEDLNITGADRTDLLSLMSGIVISERKRGKDEPEISECIDPNLFYHQKGEEPTMVSLAAPECVPDGLLYAIDDTTNIKTAMKSRFDRLTANASNQDMPCNRFHRYQPNSTSLSYRSSSGFVPEEFMAHQAITINRLRAELKFRESGDPKTYCASNVLVSPEEISAFYPNNGIHYGVHQALFAISDGPSGEIQYKDAGYGSDNAHMTFHLGLSEAMGSAGGAAYLARAHKTAMSEAVQSLITRAKTIPADVAGSVKECP